MCYYISHLLTLLLKHVVYTYNIDSFIILKPSPTFLFLIFQVLPQVALLGMLSVFISSFFKNLFYDIFAVFDTDISFVMPSPYLVQGIWVQRLRLQYLIYKYP